MANDNALDFLFKNNSNLSNLKKEVGTIKSMPKALNFLTNPAVVTTGGMVGLQGMKDVVRYINSLGDYGAVADKDKNARQVISDFNKLYFGKNTTGVGNKGLETIMRVNGLYSPAKNKTKPIAKTSQPTPQAKAIQVNNPVPKQLPTGDLNIPDLALPLPSNAINFSDTSAIQPDSTGLPLISPELNNIPIQTQTQGAKQSANKGPSIDDILALAQQQTQIKSDINEPTMKKLQAFIDNYDKNSNASFWRTLGLAGVSKLLKERTPMEAAKYSDYNRNNMDVLNLMANLDKMKEQRVFNPLPIMGNIALSESMGISPIASMANPDLIKVYGNMYGQNLGYTEALNKLKNEMMIASMLEQGRADRANLDAQLTKNKLELEKWKQLNPTNQLPAQAQLIGSLVNAASFNRNMQSMLTPEFLNYAMGLTGYAPSSLTPQQQAKIIMSPNNKSGVNVPIAPVAR